MSPQTPVPSVLNPKTLERQLKLYETRLQELQGEVDSLERLRSACQLLLGTASGEEQRHQDLVEKEAPATKKARIDLTAQLDALFDKRDGTIAVEVLTSELRRSEPLVLAALKKHPSRFIEAEPGLWTRSGETPALEDDAEVEGNA